MKKTKEKMKPFIWNGFKTNYLIGDHGSVYNLKTGKFMKTHHNYAGYMFVGLSIEKMHINIGIHRMIALTFIPNPENKPEVNHKDAIRDHNWVDNLEWVTHAENLAYAVKMGNSKRVTLKEKTVHKICKMLEDRMKIAHIANKLDLGYHIVKGIKTGKYYPEISSQYNMPLTKPHNKLIGKVVQKICDLRYQGLSATEISKITGISENTIRALFKKKYWSKITAQYAYPTDKTNHYLTYNGYKDIIDKYVLEGKTVKEIINLIDTDIFTEDKLRSLISRRRVKLHKNGHSEIKLVNNRKWEHLYEPIERMIMDGMDVRTIFHIIGNGDESIRKAIYKRVISLKKRGLLPDDYK